MKRPLLVFLLGFIGLTSSGSTPLIDKVIKAHDPRGVWKTLESVTIPIEADGPFFTFYGQAGIFDQDGTATIFTKQMKVVFTNFPKKGHKGVFLGDLVYIEDESGVVTKSMKNPRARILEDQDDVQFNKLEILYFFGYAIWNYVNFPYLLDSETLHVQELGRVREDGRTLDKIEVRYPAGFHTHSKKQYYYFREDGLLHRHDYKVEITKNRGDVHGEHYTLDWKATPEGFRWATKRRVKGTLYGLDPSWIPFVDDCGISADIPWIRLTLL